MAATPPSIFSLFLSEPKPIEVQYRARRARTERKGEKKRKKKGPRRPAISPRARHRGALLESMFIVNSGNRPFQQLRPKFAIQGDLLGAVHWFSTARQPGADQRPFSTGSPAQPDQPSSFFV
jgi:hypothetical protein